MLSTILNQLYALSSTLAIIMLGMLQPQAFESQNQRPWTQPIFMTL